MYQYETLDNRTENLAGGFAFTKDDPYIVLVQAAINSMMQDSYYIQKMKSCSTFSQMQRWFPRLLWRSLHSSLLPSKLKSNTTNSHPSPHRNDEMHANTK